MELQAHTTEALRERVAKMMERMRSVPGDRSGWSWPIRENWQERSEKLFTLAGEVQMALVGRAVAQPGSTATR